MAIPLQRSLLELCRKQIATDSDFMRERGWTKPPAVDERLFEEYRLFKLRRTIAYAADRSRFYAEAFAASGINLHRMSLPADIQRIPFTTASDIASDPYAFLCISQALVERPIVFTSSGTIGPKKSLYFSMPDIERMTDFMAAGMKTVAGSDDVVQILLPEGPELGQCDLLARGVAKMGARAVVSGMFAPASEQIECIRRNGSTVLFGETHLIYRITKLMEKHQHLDELGVHTVFVTTSHASPLMKEYLAGTWRARVATHYGLTEMGLGLAVDCPACDARHFNELDVYAEVVDPTTGKRLPLGSSGELVFTTLDREAMPLVRYRTRDLSTLGASSAVCGSFLHTIGDVECRIESTVVLREGGFKLHPSFFHDALFAIPEVVDYEVSIHGHEVDVLRFDIEVIEPSEHLHARTASALRSQLRSHAIPVDSGNLIIQFRPAGYLQQGRHFKKIVKDYRRSPSDIARAPG